MKILKRLLEIGVFILQFIIAGYFLFNSTFIHAHFLAKLSAELNKVNCATFKYPASKAAPIADQIPKPVNSKKSSSKSTDDTIYYQIMTLAGFYLLIPIDLRIFKRLFSILKNFVISNNSPPDIFQFYLFRGPPLFSL